MSYEPAHDIASSYERAFRKQLRRDRVTAFDAKKLETAYRGYLRNQPPTETSRHGKQLQRDIDAAISGRPR
jgi:hypothetical protein